MKHSIWSLLRTPRFWGCLALTVFLLRLLITMFDGDTTATFDVSLLILGLALLFLPKE